MAVSDLNIALRLDNRDFVAGMKRTEAALQSSTARLSSIGNSMAFAFTAPLALIGGAALKASGEFERLQRGLEATMSASGYSIAQVTEEMEKLREAAKAPGLDFKEAIHGSIALQAVGLSAERARETIAQFANGVAAAGGTSQNLDGVVVQLGQMIAKGKVFTQDLKIIKENMPSVSAAMVRAFGTADAEGIQKLNISADEFVKTITEELAKAPRVVGGLANSMVNAQAAIQQAAAKLGETLNRTFNITANIDAFGAWVVDLTDKFAQLDEGTQRLIIGVGIFVAALGPAIRVGGVFVGAIGRMIVGMETLKLAMARSETATLGLGTAFTKLSFATKLTIVGAAIGVILAATAAFKLMNKEVSAGAEAQAIFADATKETNAEAAKEVAVLNKNIDVLKNVNASQYDRKKAIEELKAAYPEYLRGMDVEKLSISQLDELQKSLNSSILRGVAERKKAAAINQIYEKQADLILRVQELKKGAAFTFEEANLLRSGENVSVFDSFSKAKKDAAIIGALQDKIKALGVEAVKSGESFDAAFGLKSDAYRAASAMDDDFDAAADRLNAMKLGGEGFASAMSSAEKSTKSVKKTLDDIGSAASKITDGTGGGFDFKKFNQFKPLEPLPGAGGGLGKTEFGVSLNQVSQLNSTATGLDAVAESLGVTTDAWAKYNIQAQIASGLTYDISEGQKLLIELANAVGNSIVKSSAESGASVRSLANDVADAAQSIIASFIQRGVAGAVTGVLENTPPPLSLILAPIAGAAAAAIFNAAINKVRAPHLAQGGLAYAPTMAMVGDNKGAASDPEVIAPLSKLQNIIGKSNSGIQQQLYSIIRGDDIIMVSDRARAKRNRYR